MEHKNNSYMISRRKILSLILLIVFSLAFIFACMKNVLPVGAWIAGTFGVATYPLMVILAIVELARFLGFSYTRNKKSTFFFLMIVLSLLLVIHSISTYHELDKVVGFRSLGNYLNYSYQGKLTLLGSFGSIFTGLISTILGAMGAIVIFVILFTTFIGLFVDFQFYGKYEQPKVKKLKTRTLREKVDSSDKRKTADGKPEYSFSENKNDEEVATITVDENELASVDTENKQTLTYSEDDVVSTITDDEITSTGLNFAQENEKPAEFSDEFYEPKTYPDVYSNDEMNDYRREFMRATFGGNMAEQSKPIQPETEPHEFVVPEYTENQTSNDVTLIDPVIETTQKEEFDLGSFNFSDSPSNDLWGSGESQNDTKEEENPVNQPDTENSLGSLDIDDEISKIFSTSEDEILEKEPQKPDYSELDRRASERIAESFRKPEETFVLGGANIRKPSEPEPEKQNLGFTQNTNQFVTNTTENVLSSINEIPPQNQNIMPSQKPKIPSAGTQRIVNQTGMMGLRYNPPPLSLLKAPVADNGNYSEEQRKKSAKLEEVLKAFNIPATVVNIVRGPKITRYEISVPYGVPTKRIPMQEADIARALAAKTIVIRAPIPGSQYIGIELENDSFTSVYERELLESPEFQNAKDPLPIAIGKDISGEIIVKSLAKMVHLLIAGSTGSGKSVFIHNVVLSLIYKSSPEDLRLIMIDPKRVEFNRYNGLPHLITPEVVMGSEKALNALKWCVKEMDRRYELMSKAGYNNIVPYNKSDLVKAGQFEKFPYIVIIVDELAEVMMVNKKEVDACLQRLTQLARACGMHLVLATQRPSVDIITGVIKNNITSRIAFRLQSGIDSKTILGTIGAEKLLGQGDMLLSLSDTSAMPRLQAAYASDEEIKAVIDYDIKNNAASYDETIEGSFNSEQQSADDANFGGGMGGDAVPPKEKVDDYFKTAVKLVMMNGGASVSYLQRRLSIGYSRAARIVDQMEEKGYIAPSTGSKLRKVVITPEKFREDFGEDYDSID